MDQLEQQGVTEKQEDTLHILECVKCSPFCLSEKLTGLPLCSKELKFREIFLSL